MSTDRAPEKRAHILSRQPDPPLLLSAVTVSELSYGVEKSKWRKANTALLDKFLRDFHIVPYDERAARICGVLRAALEKKASSAEFVGTDLRRIYASDSLLGIKLRSIGPKFWVSKNLLGC
ncbi:MAG: type II toxin-antitoxin system VapC family toxin, partial [Gammaproteobacteria bacterium]